MCRFSVPIEFVMKPPGVLGVVLPYVALYNSASTLEIFNSCTCRPVVHQPPGERLLGRTHAYLAVTNS